MNNIKWISIKIKKPKLGEQVLCYHKGVNISGEIYEGYRILYYLKPSYDKRRRGFYESIWYEDISDRCSYPINRGWPVTHWAYLDQPLEDNE